MDQADLASALATLDPSNINEVIEKILKKLSTTNVATAYEKIEASTIVESDKILLRGLVTAKSEVANGISILQTSIDESLLAILKANHQGNCLLVRFLNHLFYTA